jgi:FtsP/CotA-like multicopper oxidase with cupredoxin domain
MMQRRWSAVASLTVLWLAVPALLWLALVLPPVKRSAGPSTAAREQGMVAGQPFVDPPDATNAAKAPDSIVLDAQTTHFDLAGRAVWGQSYTGSFVGPTIHLTPGADARIVLINHLPVATNLHFHGLHVSPSGDADNPFICVAPGQTYVYHLALPVDHPVGTFWYHSHAMGTVCPDRTSDASTDDMSPSSDMSFVPGDVENQIFSGLSGALVVGDDRDLLPAALAHITAHTLVLKDAQIDRSDDIVQNSGATAIDSNEPTVRLVNGLFQPALAIRPGETQLWRLLNAGADIFYQLQLDGYQFTVIGEDGRPAAGVRTETALLLPPGKRYDVLVTAPSEPGDAWLRTTDYSTGPQGDSYPETLLASVNVGGVPETTNVSVEGPLQGAPADLTNAPIAQHRTVTLSERQDRNATLFYINGKQFSMDTSVFETPALLNTVEEWTVVNESGEDHPFHIHTNAFQVISINGSAQPYNHVQDIVTVPRAANGTPGTVMLRIAFTDYPGHWMFHCHIAAHEDNGMMSFVDVLPAQGSM